MSNILIQQLINNEISFDCFKNWILSQDNGTNFKCSQSDFLTYFLNFIHGEINIEKKFGSDSVKNTPTKLKPTIEVQEFSSKSSLSDKSSTFPSSSRKSLEKSFNLSTPKSSSNSELFSGYCSPISPLYKERNFTTPKYKNSVCLGDFLIKSTKKKSVCKNICDGSNRRITPTSLVNITKESFVSSNSFNNFNETKEISGKNTKSNRLFRPESSLENKLDNNQSDTSISDQIEPQLNFVSYKKQLNIFSDIYIFLLRNKLVLNVTAEMYFLISLLVVKKPVSQCKNEYSDVGIDFLKDDVYTLNISEYFNNVHNIIYFTVRCLETMFDVLKYYDKSTLKLLSLNGKLKEFSPTFSEKLAKLSETKPERRFETVRRGCNVCYNLDTDTKSNFPSEMSFLAFRKQRDLFYEILRIWEKNRLLGGWSFQVGLGGKIRSLMCLHNDPTNFMHLAKLFKAQLIASCGMAETEEGLDEDQLLSNFPNIDPGKLSRLKNRLVTKQSSNGLNSLPHFFGYQEFYKEFILISANHNFNVHLRDAFIAEIIELNAATFDLAGLEESDIEVDSNIRQSFFINIKNLRMLAKFLGFVESIPYKSEVNNYPENTLESHFKIRDKKTPCFDVKKLLLSSIKNNRVVLLIAWLVKYLSMLDYVTLRLPYYLSLYELLYQIYHSYEKTSKKIDYNNALIQFSLGWLFDLPKFPDADYTTFRKSKNVHFIRKCNTLDDISIVDQNILYFCCPYLEEIKKILTNSIGNCTVTVKHITPVSAVESSEQISKKRLEQQLEETFFNGQPDSVKKTIEFVSERLASTCVKHICNTIVPTIRKEALKTIKTFLQSQTTSTIQENNHRIILRMKISQLAQENLIFLNEKCSAEVSSILRVRLPISIENLLAIDTLSQTKLTCVSIASRMCKERLTQWMNCHVTISIFTKDFEKELNKIFINGNKKNGDDKIVFSLPSIGRRESHDEDSLSAFHLLEKIKTTSVDILDGTDNVDKKTVLDIVAKAYTTLTARCDVNDIITSNICNCLLDFSLLLIARRLDLMPQNDLWKLLIKIWIWYSKTRDNLFNDLLSPRNITLMNDSKNQRASWKAFAELVALLIIENVVRCDNFESQCIAFFRKDWEQAVVNNVCYFMREFVKIFNENRSNCNQFTMLLEFLADFCLDTENK
ncbi:codanin-1 [Diorhabda sublineata]|uniref:codanin-1 n=1 Tax=Diorhabda sublineata TaxID=1163346 RepID=UPI0024E0EA8D|nr:codanin-1 [Diorhabda sublineata]